jgi:hypothetical protein
MNFVVALAVMFGCMVGGPVFGILIFSPGWYRTKRAKVIHASCCTVVFLAGILMFITMLNSPVETIGTECNAYDIEKMTRSMVVYNKNTDEDTFIYFNDDCEYSIEKATDKYNNVVVEEQTHYVRHWWWDLNYTPVKYIVYLDDNAWEKYQYDGIVIDNTQED